MKQHFINQDQIVGIKISPLSEVSENYYGEPYLIKPNTRKKWFGLVTIEHPQQIGYYGWSRIDSIEYFTRTLTQYQLIGDKVYNSPTLRIYCSDKNDITLHFKTDEEMMGYVKEHIPNYKKWLKY